MILKDVTTRIWSTLFPWLSAYAGWWQEPYCAPQISSLTFDLLATGRLPQCRGILAFINLFIIQFKWNATTEAGTITSRGEDNQRNENKMDFFSSFIQLFTFYFNSWSMMQCYGCSRFFQFSILVMSSRTMCAASVLHIPTQCQHPKKSSGQIFILESSVLADTDFLLVRVAQMEICLLCTIAVLEAVWVLCMQNVPRTHLSHSMAALWD